MKAAPVMMVVAVVSSTTAAHADPTSPTRYDLVWDSPSRDHHGSMPLGNGDIGLNAWVEPSGDLLFYIGKTDAWSDNGRLLKLGRVRVHLDPPAPTRPFEQTLNLDDATMTVRYGEADDTTVIRLWVDVNHPLIHVTVGSARERTATASIELWRTKPQELPEAEVSDLLEDRSKPNRLHEAVIVEPDTIITDPRNRIGWFHHNRRSVGPDLIARLQGLSDYFSDKTDPLLQRTFGAVITAEAGERVDATHLRSAASEHHRFDVFVLTEHPASPKQWSESIDRLVTRIEKRDFHHRRTEHERWWRTFWERSWIHVSAADSTPRSPVPGNAHPVRIGIDQHDQNAFVGEIGRVTLVPRALPEARIAELARVGWEQPLPAIPGALYQDRATRPTSIAASSDWSFSGGLTIEAWIKPGDLPPGGGRIVDKSTPGASDGLLFDTYPGHSLRLIVGRDIVSKNDALAEGRWSHVAATIDTMRSRLAIYLDGAPLVSQALEPADDALVVSRAYALQRFIDACAGRGHYPIKFNGSIFTVPHEGKFGDADYRRWGPGYWWQNTRLPYLSMPAAGDFEMMEPLFRMYADELLPLHKLRTRRYTGHDGAFVPECIYFWGPTFTATYGWTPFDERGADKLQESGWHKWEWVSGPELVWMMLDYYEYTENHTFLNATLLPFAEAVLTFFDQHYETDDRGKLVMHPSQAAETWWNCTNPMPEVAGLHAVIGRLRSLPERLTTPAQRRFWLEFQTRLPDLPTREVDGVRMLAPAEEFAEKRNIENPELYAVFPFRLVSFEKPNADLGFEALTQRSDKGNFGWRQDDLFMAYLGLANEARDNLVGRARNKHGGSRFPAFWGPNYDWIPDQDHGGVLTRTLQAMLMQTDGRKIHLLPAWPTDWNVDFKLHAPFRTTVAGRVRDGSVRDLKVEPESRRRDIVIHKATAAR